MSQVKGIEKVAEIDNGVLLNNKGLTGSLSVTEYRVSDLYSIVKTFDKDFSAGKQVNDALLNDDGSPRKFYHGTRASFDSFDRSRLGSNTGTEVSKNWFFAAD